MLRMRYADARDASRKSTWIDDSHGVEEDLHNLQHRVTIGGDLSAARRRQHREEHDQQDTLHQRLPSLTTRPDLWPGEANPSLNPRLLPRATG